VLDAELESLRRAFQSPLDLDHEHGAP
jgi:hypothetical protein